jgi:DNA topoisomerase-1
MHSERALVIVESPTKARTITRFLPKSFKVVASVGHIRDLPQSAADVPAKYKKEAWARLGINVDEDFKPLWITPKGKASVIREIKALMKESDVLYLATDEDREGESISWHLLDVLKPKIPVKRMVFHEITQKAITAALEDTREVDTNLVSAQEARRVLDRLVGFTLSPLIWKKIAYGLSAGRVQSPGLRLIVERELARCRFKPAGYWDLKASLLKDGESRNFEAKIVSYQGKKVAEGKDFDPETGTLKKPGQVQALSEEEAAALKNDLKNGPWTVSEVTEKENFQKPAPPFITSTLQQEGNRKLNLSARDTMRIAQKLYEEGLITYMRTDSPSLSSEAIAGAREAIANQFGAEYLAEEARQFSSKSKGAQESHEAIRPAGSPFKTPEQTGLSGRERALYELIWKRTLACQMKVAHKKSISVKIAAGEALFGATGVRILFPGFLRAYVRGNDDPSALLEDKEVYLPALEKDEVVNLDELNILEHWTKPPSRFTEAALVQKLEKEGIGRPSTYATIIGTLIEREYVFRKDGALVPTFVGMAVVKLLDRHFHRLIDYDFTSELEESLDHIAAGDMNRLEYLREFYLNKKGLKNQVDELEPQIDPAESRTVILPQLPQNDIVKVGRYGPYIVHQDEDGKSVNASLPEGMAPSDVTPEDLEEIITLMKEGPKPIGQDPETGKNIYCLTGRYGPHLQVGEKGGEEKPRTLSLPKGMKMSEVTMEIALKLLSLPRELGNHPDTGLPISANNGRFGPYVVHDGNFRSLKKEDDVYTVGLERALELLSQEKKGRGNQTILKDFGTDNPTKKKLQILDGRYGPYIKAGTKNISIPDKDISKEALAEVSMEVVMEWVKNAQAKKGKKK